MTYVCMTWGIFTIVYRLFHFYFDYITIPGGQNGFTYTKLTVPFNSLENSPKWCQAFRQIANSDRLYFKGYLQTQCLFAWNHGKVKRNQPRPQKKKSGLSLGAISKCLKIPNSCVCKYKYPGTMQPSYCSGRRCILSPSDEHILVRKVQINPRTTSKDLLKMLDETVRQVSMSTVKQIPIEFACAHGGKDFTFWRNILWSDHTNV